MGRLYQTQQVNNGGRLYKQPEIQEKPKTITDTLAEPIRGGLVGAAKGVGSTLFGIGQLGAKASGMIGLGGMVPEALKKEKPEFLKPKTTAEKIGYGAEQISEFFVPITKAGKIEKGLSIAKDLNIAGKTLKYGTKFLRTGTEDAVKTAAQTGGDIPQTTGTFLLSLGSQVALKPIGGLLKKTGKILPERIYSRIFQTAEDDLRNAYESIAKGKKINPTLAREVLDRGLRGNSKNMAVYSFNKLDDLEKEVQQYLPSLKPIIVENKKAYINFLDEVNNQYKGGFFTERATKAKNLLNELKSQKGKEIAADIALKLRRFIDDMRNTSSFRIDPKLSARQDEFRFAANSLRKKLSEAGLKDLMNEERIYIEAIDNIVSDAAKRNNKNIIGLVDLLAGGGGMVAGGLGQGIGAAAAIRAFQQPFTLTNLGYIIDRLTKKTEGLGGILSKLTTGAGAQLQR